jgi:tetratricopeptide (TPR) repeat protein
LCPAPNVIAVHPSTLQHAIAQFDAGQWSEALTGLDSVLREDPANRQALNYQARTYEAMGRLDQALRSIDRSLALHSNDSADHRNRGVTLLKLDRLEEAVESFDHALALRPDFTDALLKRAVALDALERREEALESAERALALEPSGLDALHVRGRILDHLLRHDEALEDFKRMAELDPDNVEAINNIGMIHSRHGRFEEALACYDRSLALRPGVSHTLYNRSVVRLALGDWARGFEEYEIRWKVAPLEKVRFDKLGARWTRGAELTGKVILLHHEQGYGDTLLCLRYVPLLQDLGARVVIAVPRGLRRLMDSLTGSPDVVAEGDPIPAHDCFCPFLSLPHAFGTTPESVPANVPYLFADDASTARWAQRLGPATRRRIGLVWSGRQFPPVNYARDVPLDTLRPVLELDADFITLQPEISDGDRDCLRSMPHVRHFGEQLGDFSDTAGLIENLDLVIAADTAVAHLAGALGKPVWLMNRFAPCWRWLQGREDSPWYPTLRQFRQTALGDWGGVAARMRNALEAFIQDPQTINVTRSRAWHEARAARQVRKASLTAASHGSAASKAATPASTNKIRLVCATRLAQEQFFATAALARSLPYYRRFPKGQPIDLRLFANHVGALGAAYNAAIEEARSECVILVFIREDVYLSDYYWARRLLEGLKDFELIGLAGNRRRAPGQASWLYLDDRLTEDAPENLSGAVGYGTGYPGVARFEAFGAPGREVRLLDGTLLAVRSSTLFEKNLRFDPRFPTHFHDVDFCRQAEALGVRMGTWPIATIRVEAPPCNEEWRAAYQEYLTKYGEGLPEPRRREAPEGNSVDQDFEHAFAAHGKGRIDDAVAGYRRALRSVPQHPQALHFLGVGLAQLNQLDEATGVLAKAIDLKPKDALLQVHYGNALRSQHRTEEALGSYDRAIALEPGSVDAHYSRGAALNELDRPEAALASFDRALELAPGHAEAFNGRGIALAALGRDAEALESYNHALEWNPGFSEARWNKSLALLRRGDFTQGWECHAACPEYQCPKALQRFPSKRPWDGMQSLTGKSLLLHADQGYGDVVQYCRYAPRLRARGARVLVEAPRPLHSLLRSLDGVDTLVVRSRESALGFDLHCPFSNLPAAFRTHLDSIPRDVPYLSVDAESKRRWAARLGARRGLRAGLVWSGNPAHRQDASRSIPLEALSPLKDQGVEFVSLQKEVRPSDVHWVATLCRWNLGDDLQDFGDTAALISQLDVVISVDTSVAHVAGALGARVWILLPFVPDWRWMQGRRDSPWYPTARLFRQSVRGQWGEPIQAVHEELMALKRVGKW